MKIPLPSLVAAAFASTLLAAGPALAQDHRGPRERGHEHYANPHWVYDARFHHDHYYPARGYAVNVLPPGYVSLNYRGAHFFFQAGVWFAPGPNGYVVVQPPLGIPVPMLPPGYVTVWSRGVPYYYANDVYYVQGPGGYVVSQPPTEPAMAQQPMQPPANLPPQAGAAPQAAPGTWYYCESAKAYYPYVASCAEGWRSVPAAPPPAR